MESVNARSLSALTLRMWIGDLDENSFSMLLGADFTVSGDWLFLALAGMGTWCITSCLLPSAAAFQRTHGRDLVMITTVADLNLQVAKKHGAMSQERT